MPCTCATLSGLCRSVALKEVLSWAEPKDSGRQVTFIGLDNGVVGGGDFVKALGIQHAMNGADTPMLNGYPVKLIVPGNFGTYWVKHHSEISAVDKTPQYGLGWRTGHSRSRLSSSAMHAPLPRPWRCCLEAGPASRPCRSQTMVL